MTMNPLGFGVVAIVATASLALAGGDDEKKPGGGTPTQGSGGSGGTTEATFKYSPSKGMTIEGGDSFMLNMKNRIQPYYSFIANDDSNPAINGGRSDTSSFSIRRARTKFEGYVYSKDITYRLQTDWVEGTSIKDAWIHWFFMNKDGNKIGLRFGQQKTYFGREATGSSGGLEFVDRSLAGRVMSNRRQRGAAVTGEHAEGKFHWTAGAFNGDTAGGSVGLDGITEEAANTDNELTYIFTARLDPNGDMGDEGYMQGDLDHSPDLKWSIGAGLQLGNNKATLAGPDVDNTEININASMKLNGFHVLGEVFLRSDELDAAGSSSADSTGFVVGGSYTFEKQVDSRSQWAVGARYSMVNVDDIPVLLTATPLGAVPGDVNEISFVVSNYYHQHNLKTQASWTLQNVDPDAGSDATNHIFEVQVTLVF
jgi:phosphate-selective porin OprO/OprP